MKANLLLSAMFVSAAACVGGPSFAQSTEGVPNGPVVTRAVRVLPYDVSRSLKITRTPTSRPTPFIIGVYWNCHDAGNDFNVCRLVTVVCTDDQSWCVEL